MDQPGHPKQQPICIHMAMHRKDGRPCQEHPVIEVDRVDFLNATEHGDIAIIQLKAYFDLSKVPGA